MSDLKQKIVELEKRIEVLEDWSGIKGDDEGVHVFPIPELMSEKPWIHLCPGKKEAKYVINPVKVDDIK